MHYTLNQLQIYLKVVKAKSITKAAEELHLTQPAISIQLRNFQAQFEIPLTEIIGKKIHITDFGREIAEAAEQIIDQVNAIHHKTLAYQGLLAGRLKISVVSTGKYVMPYFLSSFMGAHDGIQLSMDVTNKNKVLESLESNAVDFALVSIMPSKLNIDKLDLLQNKLYLVGRPGDKLPKGASNHVIFKHLPLIFREEGSGTRQEMENFFERNGISVFKKMELTSNEAVKQALLAGLGYSIMPVIGIKNELKNEELAIFPVKGLPIKTTWSLIWQKGRKHSPVAAAFLQHLKREKAQIVHHNFKWSDAY